MHFKKRIRANSKILEQIASSYPPHSKENKALQASAFAFGYVMLFHEEAFDKFNKEIHPPLPKKQKRK